MNLNVGSVEGFRASTHLEVAGLDGFVPAQTGVMGANSGDALRFWGMKTERHALSLKIVGGSPRMGHRRAIHAK